MMKSFAITILAVASTVFAELSINNPVAGTVWNAGAAATVSWISTDNSPLTGNVQIELLRGDDPNDLQTLETIASGIDASAGTFNFNVPTDFNIDAFYAVRITPDGEAPKYSHYFTVVGGSSVPLTTSETETTSSGTETTSGESTSGKETSKNTKTESDSDSKEASKASSDKKTKSSSRSKSASGSESEEDSEEDSSASNLAAFGLSAVFVALLTAQLF